MRVTLYITLLGLLGTSIGQSNDEGFGIKVDDAFARPILRWDPPTDNNGDTPREVLLEFLKFVKTNKYDNAASLCSFGWVKGDGLPDDWKSIEGDHFRKICDQINSNTKDVLISGSTVRQKAYRSITCEFTDKKGNKHKMLIYFVKIRGVWKIKEGSVSTIQHFLAEDPNGGLIRML